MYWSMHNGIRKQESASNLLSPCRLMCNCQKHHGNFCLLLELQEVIVVEFDRNTEANDQL